MFKQLVIALSAAVFAAVLTAIASHAIMTDINKFTISNLQADIDDLKEQIQKLTEQQSIIDNSLHANRIFFASRHPDGDLAILYVLSKFWKMTTGDYETVSEAIINGSIRIDGTAQKPVLFTANQELKTLVEKYQLDMYDIDSLKLLSDVYKFEFSEAEPGQRVEWFDNIAKSVERNNQFRQRLIDYSRAYESLLRRTTQVPDETAQ